MATSTSTQGFAGMSEAERRKYASEGGSKSGGKFKTGDKRTIDAAKKGAGAQPVEAKRRGGMNSHKAD